MKIVVTIIALTCSYGLLAQSEWEYCGAGTVWNSFLQQCVTDTDVCGEGTEWNNAIGQCVPLNLCSTDINGDGVVGVGDLLNLLSAFGFQCEESNPEFTCGQSIEYYDFTYSTVQMGDDCWFAEDLKTTRFNNGDTILKVQENTENALIPTYYSVQNDSVLNGETVFLYNLSVNLDLRQVCPVGWSIPSDLDWFNLLVYAGMDSNENQQAWGQASGDSVSIRLKSVDHWHEITWPEACTSPPAGTDEYGFDIRPMGTGEFKYVDGEPYDAIAPWVGSIARYYTSTFSNSSIELRGFPCLDWISNMVWGMNSAEHGAIRCVKD